MAETTVAPAPETTVAAAVAETTVAPAPETTVAAAPETTAAPAEPATTVAAPAAPAVAAGELDTNLEANFGTIVLDPGFEPDPAFVAVTSGGDVDVSYLGGDCVGFASVAPDLRLDYAEGGAYLRISATPDVEGDTAMVINDPEGNWICNDDGFLFDPGVEFINPSGGIYDIWIASFTEGEFIDGTVVITEIS